MSKVLSIVLSWLKTGGFKKLLLKSKIRSNGDSQFQQLAEIINSAMDAIITIDANQYIRLFNTAAEKMFKCSASDVIGKPLTTLIPERMRKQHETDVNTFGKTSMTRRSMAHLGIVYGLRANGEEFPLEVSISQTEFNGEKTFTAILRDITERLHTEAAEHEQRNLAEALRDTAAVLNSTLNLDELLGHILDNVGRVVPHESANIALLESRMVRIVRVQGNSKYGTLKPLDIPPISVDDLPQYREMLESGHTVLVTDTQLDPSQFRIWEVQWTQSYVGAPIRVRGQNIGFINLNSSTRGFFAALHAEHLQAFADQAGSALENAHLLEEIRQRLKELEAINKISTTLRVSQTLGEMIPQFLDETISVLNGVAGSIWFYDSTSDKSRMVYQNGWNVTEFPPVKRGEGIPGRVIADGQPYLSRNFKKDPQVPEYASQFIPSEWGGACVPISAADEIIGVLFVNTALPHEFTHGDVQLLVTLAEIAGNAIHRARLYEQTIQRLERIAALHEIDVAINSSLDIQPTLNLLLTQVTTQLNADAADILLFNPQTNVLECVSGRGFHGKIAGHPKIRPGEGLAGQILLEQCTLNITDLAKTNQYIRRNEIFQSEGFVTYHGVPLISKGMVQGVLEVFHRKSFSSASDWMDFLETLAGQAAIAIESATLLKNLQRSNLELSVAYDATIEGWSRALDLRDKETEGHTQRVTEVSLRLAQVLGLSDIELMHMRRGGLLHDIGKLGVPDNILMKPGKLTDEEWGIMRMHPVYAYEMLSPIQYLRPAIYIPYCHHEKWDGSGYPRGLSGTQIPFVARIFAVVDVWDALRSNRPYREGWPEEKVLNYIREQAGTHFDPEVVEAFLKIMKNDLPDRMI